MVSNNIVNGINGTEAPSADAHNGASGGVGATTAASAVGGGGASGLTCVGGIDYASDSKLRRIADDLREMMPLNAILPTEQITFPSVGEVRYLS